MLYKWITGVSKYMICCMFFMVILVVGINDV